MKPVYSIIVAVLTACGPDGIYESNKNYFAVDGAGKAVTTVDLRDARVLLAPGVRAGPAPDGTDDSIRRSECRSILEFFFEGEVASDDPLVLVVDNETVPVRLDIQSTHNDGSVKQAFLIYRERPVFVHAANAILTLAATNEQTIVTC